MRKLTAAQIATMTASVTASLGMVAATTIRYGIPMGLVTLAHADVYSDDELDDWIFTGYVSFPWILETYRRPPSSNPGTPSPPPPPTPPVARAPTDATGPIQRNATRCAMRYSINLSVTFPNLGKGPMTGFGTKFVRGYAWGANTIHDNPPYIVTPTNVPPDDRHTGHILGKTTFSERTVYIFVDEVQRDAAARGIDFQENLVNTIAHEWSHSWWSPRLEEEAVQIGNAAGEMYRRDGGASAECNTRPPHNGNLGGRK